MSLNSVLKRILIILTVKILFCLNLLDYVWQKKEIFDYY